MPGTETLRRNPQTLIAGLRPNPDKVSYFVDVYTPISQEQPGGIVTATKALRTNAINFARLGRLQMPDSQDDDQFAEMGNVIDTFRAAEQLGLPETPTTQIERMELCTLASLSRAEHVLHRIIHPDSNDERLYEGTLTVVQDAIKLVDLPFDGFSSEVIEATYVPERPFDNREPTEPSTAYVQAGFFNKLLKNAANFRYSSPDSVLYFENAAGQRLSSEMRVALHTLYSIAGARTILESTFVRDYDHQTVIVPPDERGEVHKSLSLARDFALAKVQIMAEQMGLDLSAWLEGEK